VGRSRERGLINLLTVKFTNLFKKDYKLMKKRGLNIKLLQEVVGMLANEQTLPEKYKDHYLLGEYKRI
jgi:mRNA interferase YafQ